MQADDACAQGHCWHSSAVFFLRRQNDGATFDALRIHGNTISALCQASDCLRTERSDKFPVPAYARGLIYLVRSQTLHDRINYWCSLFRNSISQQSIISKTACQTGSRVQSSSVKILSVSISTEIKFYVWGEFSSSLNKMFHLTFKTEVSDFGIIQPSWIVSCAIDRFNYPKIRLLKPTATTYINVTLILWSYHW